MFKISCSILFRLVAKLSTYKNCQRIISHNLQTKKIAHRKFPQNSVWRYGQYEVSHTIKQRWRFVTSIQSKNKLLQICIDFSFKNQNQMTGKKLIKALNKLFYINITEPECYSKRSECVILIRCRLPLCIITKLV